VFPHGRCDGSPADLDGFQRDLSLPTDGQRALVWRTFRHPESQSRGESINHLALMDVRRHTHEGYACLRSSPKCSFQPIHAFAALFGLTNDGNDRRPLAFYVCV